MGDIMDVAQELDKWAKEAADISSAKHVDHGDFVRAEKEVSDRLRKLEVLADSLGSKLIIPCLKVRWIHAAPPPLCPVSCPCARALMH